jgi:glucitol operon activator protein
MENMTKLVFVFFALFIVQGAMTFFQIKNYKKHVSEIRRKGDMLVGQAKGGIKPGCIIMMALDSKGNITESRRMAGRTVFNRFKNIDDFNGKNVYESEEWLKSIKNKQIKKAVESAINTMKEQLSSMEEESNESSESTIAT